MLGERAEREETGQLRRLGRGMLLGQEKEKGPVWVEVLEWGKEEWASGLGFQLGGGWSQAECVGAGQRGKGVRGEAGPGKEWAGGLGCCWAGFGFGFCLFYFYSSLSLYS